MSNDSTIGGRAIAELNLVDGKIVAADGRSRSIEGVLKRPGVVEEYAEYVPPGMKPESVADIYAGKSVQTGGSHGPYMMYALGAEFVEVRGHALTREIRVPRIVGAFAAGRLLNTRTARSQYMGGMV